MESFDRPRHEPASDDLRLVIRKSLSVPTRKTMGVVVVVALTVLIPARMCASWQAIGTTIENVSGQSTTSTTPHVSPGPKTSPEVMVLSLWIMAARGDLLTPDGREKVGGLFVKPPKDYGKNLDVVCNYWHVGAATPDTESTGRVGVDYCPVGQIDPQLKFIPAPKTSFMEFGIEYSTTLTQKYFSQRNVDGAVTREVPAWKVWLIDGPGVPAFPFTTVNTAIRYVLEKREQAKDPVIRKNADETIASLLKLH